MVLGKKLFDSLRSHLEAIETIIDSMEKKVNLLTDTSLLQRELEDRLQDITDLNHVIDEQECEIRWLKKKLKEQEKINK